MKPIERHKASEENEMTFNKAPYYRQAELAKVAARKQAKAKYTAYMKEKLAQFNVGLISADEYYEAERSARILLIK